MNKQTTTLRVATRMLPRTLVAVAVAAVMAGCSVTPKAVTADEVRERVKADTARMYADQAPINAPIPTRAPQAGTSSDTNAIDSPNASRNTTGAAQT